MVGVLQMTKNVRYRISAAGIFRQDAPAKAPAELSAEDVEKINGLVRELRQRLVNDTPHETIEPPSRPGFARALSRAFRKS